MSLCRINRKIAAAIREGFKNEPSAACAYLTMYHEIKPESNKILALKADLVTPVLVYSPFQERIAGPCKGIVVVVGTHA